MMHAPALSFESIFWCVQLFVRGSLLKCQYCSCGQLLE